METEKKTEDVLKDLFFIFRFVLITYCSRRKVPVWMKSGWYCIAPELELSEYSLDPAGCPVFASKRCWRCSRTLWGHMAVDGQAVSGGVQRCDL